MPERQEQTIEVLQGGVVHKATISWWYTDRRWAVRVESTEFDAVEQVADDAFEALCQVREQLEPKGWHLGVAGAQADVWPSGMARDQGGGLRAYRMTEQGVGDLVDTFAPVDPVTVTTVAEQKAEAERLFSKMRHRSHPS